MILILFRKEIVESLVKQRFLTVSHNRTVLNSWILSVAGPKLWNSKSSSVRSVDFKMSSALNLKTYLFQLADYPPWPDLSFSPISDFDLVSPRIMVFYSDFTRSDHQVIIKMIL